MGVAALSVGAVDFAAGPIVAARCGILGALVVWALNPSDRAVRKRANGRSVAAQIGRGVVIALGLALVFLVGFGLLSLLGDNRYSGRDLESDLSRVMTETGTAGSSVTCPDDIRVSKGEIVSCHAVVGGKSTGIRVTFDDDKGHFTMSPEAE